MLYQIIELYFEHEETINLAIRYAEPQEAMLRNQHSEFLQSISSSLRNGLLRRNEKESYIGSKFLTQHYSLSKEKPMA